MRKKKSQSKKAAKQLCKSYIYILYYLYLNLAIVEEQLVFLSSDIQTLTKQDIETNSVWLWKIYGELETSTSESLTTVSLFYYFIIYLSLFQPKDLFDLYKLLGTCYSEGTVAIQHLKQLL